MISVGPAVLEPCPGGPERWRLSTAVDYGDGAGRSETYWITGPGPPQNIDDSGTPWMVALAPIAVTLGRPLRIAGSVDPRVRRGVEEVSRIWSRWYPELETLRVESDTEPSSPYRPPNHTAAFFSGGVDSTYSVIRDRGPAEEVTHDLLTVLGFDIPVSDTPTFDLMVGRFRAVASSWGCSVVDLATNFRETRSGQCPWGPLAHGCALIATGLALGLRYDRLRVAATAGHRDPHPWGSHFRTDPLFSSRTTEVEHDGADATRWQKVKRIAEDPAALEVLRVCWRSGTGENCGACSKCLRTMALLDLWGALERAPTFPDHLSLDALARVRVQETWDFREFGDLADLGRAHGRPDLVRTATDAMRRSRRRGRALDLLDRIAAAPAIGSTARSLQERLRQDWIP